MAGQGATLVTLTPRTVVQAEGVTSVRGGTDIVTRLPTEAPQLSGSSSLIGTPQAATLTRPLVQAAVVPAPSQQRPAASLATSQLAYAATDVPLLQPASTHPLELVKHNAGLSASGPMTEVAVSMPDRSGESAASRSDFEFVSKPLVTTSGSSDGLELTWASGDTTTDPSHGCERGHPLVLQAPPVLQHKLQVAAGMSSTMPYSTSWTTLTTGPAKMLVGTHGELRPSEARPGEVYSGQSSVNDHSTQQPTQVTYSRVSECQPGANDHSFQQTMQARPESQSPPSPNQEPQSEQCGRAEPWAW